MIKEIWLKLGRMRKAQSFIVYPHKIEDARIVIQSDKSIGRFDTVTGEGTMNFKGSYFVHLNFGTLTPITLSQEDLKSLLDSRLYAGEQIGTHLFVAPN